MKQRYLGRSGVLVSELCLGTMTFGRELDAKKSEEILDHFVEIGGTFIDTADVYSQGTSEQITGAWLNKRRHHDLIIATKVRFPMSDKPNDAGLSRKHILKAVENSLQRLRTDYIDLYQVHCWDWGAPLEETLAALDTIVQSGKVRYIGVSNYKSYQIQRAIDMSRSNRWAQFVSLQPLYNLLDRHIEFEIVELCQTEGLGIIPWAPLRGGWLSGKYRRDMRKPPKGTRLERAEAEKWSERWSVYDNERTWKIIDVLLEIAKEEGKSPSQVALNWLKDRPGVTAPIIGVSTMEQLKDNLESIGWQLSDDARARLDTVSKLEQPYPYNFITAAGDSRRR